MLGLNPQLRNMLDSNSHLREMMQNPEFIRQMTSPETMQQLLTFQQGLLSQLGQQPTNQPGQNAGGAGNIYVLNASNPNLLTAIYLWCRLLR
ncbi:hypothetical protein T459_28148 [Capsicum annuum]|uniref:STI1 domain-containing protein n=1 Tax=Capsicum annuum TaxID=4072 RepID=A0A2G2YGE7_CAPAN|nr:hypothetical protein T459_28148 [Capsicum annuum]